MPGTIATRSTPISKSVGHSRSTNCAARKRTPSPAVGAYRLAPNATPKWPRNTAPSGVARDEVLDARVDELAVLAAAEDAVVAHALRLEVLLVLRRNAFREPLRRLGLAVARDV